MTLYVLILLQLDIGGTWVMFGGQVGMVQKVPKWPQTKVSEEKSENFWRPGVGLVKKLRFLAFLRVSWHFDLHLRGILGFFEWGASKISSGGTHVFYLSGEGGTQISKLHSYNLLI